MPDTATVSTPDTDTPPAANRRTHLAPHAAVGALVVAASAARLAAHLTGDERQVATWTAGSAFVVAVVAATLAHRRLTDKRTLRRVQAFLGVAVGWLTTVAATGLTVGAVGVLMAIGYGLSMHWWRTHPVGWVETPPPAPAEYALRWADNVGGKDGCLPGSVLLGEKPIRSGVRYTLRLRPGHQTVKMVHDVIGKVRSGLQLRRDQQLIVEDHPDLPEPAALLTIITRSTVAKGVLWPGPQAFDPATGRLSAGPFIDGEGDATIRVYTDNRMWGCFFQGGTGSGKSRLIEAGAMALAASDTHPTVVLYADGQAGASSPMLMEHADFFAGTYERILAMLRGMVMLIQLRQAENVQMRAAGFTPTEARPGVLGIIDECHKAFLKGVNPEFWQESQQHAATIAKEGGKVGVALWLASQEPTLNAFGTASPGGNNYQESIRANLLTGNGIMLAGDNPNANQIFGIPANPKTFPTGGGYGHTAKAAEGERSAMFRAAHLTNQMQASWPRRIRWRSLTGRAAEVFGPVYTNREVGHAARAAAAFAPIGVQVAEPVLPGVEVGQPADVVSVDFGGSTFRAWSEMETEARVAAEAKLGDSHRKVLVALSTGRNTPKDIAPHVGVEKRRVHDLLNDLIAAGKVRRVGPPRGQGRYELLEKQAA